ncbi:MAG: hypothetical protein FWD61_20515 [Phycisphaerales bacterium]|nr:hypothetical protein [Phycisphaerales bacterium]
MLVSSNPTLPPPAPAAPSAPTPSGTDWWNITKWALGLVPHAVGEILRWEGSLLENWGSTNITNSNWIFKELASVASVGFNLEANLFDLPGNLVDMAHNTYNAYNYYSQYGTTFDAIEATTGDMLGGVLGVTQICEAKTNTNYVTGEEIGSTGDCAIHITSGALILTSWIAGGAALGCKAVGYNPTLWGEEAVAPSAIPTAAKGVSPAVKAVGDDIIRFLGKDARVITNKAGDTVFLSKDGLRRVRFDIKNPSPHAYPHSHVEVNVNGKWVKSGQLYPYDVIQTHTGRIP